MEQPCDTRIEDAQNPDVQTLLKKAQAARWAEDRQALASAIPDLVLAAGTNGKVSCAAKPCQITDPKGYAHALEGALEAFWPLETLPSELIEGQQMHQFDAVTEIAIYSGGVTRNFGFRKGKSLLSLLDYDTSVASVDSWTDARGNEYSDIKENTMTTNVSLITPRVAVYAYVCAEPFCDEHFDANLQASVYLSDDPRQMQSLLRTLVNRHFRFPENVLQGCSLEDHLQRCFGQQYAAPQSAPTPKP